MNPTLLGLLAILGMLLGMIAVLEAGRQLGARRLAKDPESAKAGSGATRFDYENNAQKIT